MPSRRTKSSAINERISQAQKERTQLACVLCRSRRIKCDGRPGTCSRCLVDRRSDCRYENVGSAERIAGRQRKRALRKQHDDEPNAAIQATTGRQRDVTSSVSSISTTSSSTAEAKMEATQPHLHVGNDDISNSGFQPQNNLYRNQVGHHLYDSLPQRSELQQEQEENWSPIIQSSFSPPPPMVGKSLERFRTSTQDLSIHNNKANEDEASSLGIGALQRRRVTSSNRSVDDMLYIDPMTASSSATNGSSMPTSWNSDSMQHQQQQPLQSQQTDPYFSPQQMQQQNDLQYQMFQNQQQQQQQQRQSIPLAQMIPTQSRQEAEDSSQNIPGDAAYNNPDMDLTSVDALWRIYDWQYRVNNLDAPFNTASTSSDFASQQHCPITLPSTTSDISRNPVNLRAVSKQ